MTTSANTHGGNDKPKSLLTVLCIYNDAVQFEEFKQTINAQDIDAKLIGIENSKSQYPSAASAFNAHLDGVTSDWVIFSHQDIRLSSPSYLGRFIGLMQHDPEAIYGVAGPASSSKNAPVLSSISDSKYRYDTLKGVSSDAFVLDECLFGCSTATAKQLRFDEELCDGWHFYAVDFCLRGRLDGHAVKVLDGKDVQHLSAGTKNASFYDAERKLARRYAGRFRWIRTTCTWFPTGALYKPFSLLRRLKHRI